MRLRFGFIAAACALVLSVVTGTQAADDAGRESLFSLGAGARSLGMGSGMTALASDATAIYYNPAGLSFLEYQEAAFMHSLLLDGASYNFASWVYPINHSSGIGVGYMRVGIGEITRRQNYQDVGEFDFSQSQFLLSYGRSFGERIGAGASLRIQNQSLDNFSDFGLSLDLGLRAQVYRNVSLGLIARNLVPASLELQNVSEDMPVAVTFGAAMDALRLSDDARLSIGVDIEKTENRDPKLLTGAELVFYDFASVRLGFARDDVSLGAGIQQGALKIDYAYKLVDYVDDLHHFSVSFLLGESKSERLAREQAAAEATEPLSEEERRLMAIRERANDFFHQFQLDSALAYYELYAELEPSDQEVASTIAAIKQAMRLQLEQEGELEQARTEMRNYLRNFYAQAQLLYSQGFYRAAEDMLDLIFDIEPQNADALQLQAQIESTIQQEIQQKLDSASVWLEAGRTVDAIEAYNRVLALNPDNEEVQQRKQDALARLDLPQLLNRGIVLFEEGKLSQAEQRFRSALEIQPGEPVAREYLDKIAAARQTEKPSQPQRATRLEDLQRDPAMWQLYLEGLQHMRNGQYQQAINDWQKVLEKYPNLEEAISNIEQARLRLQAE